MQASLREAHSQRDEYERHHKRPRGVVPKAVEIAEAQHVSIDDVFASAFVEQLAAWERLLRPAVATISADGKSPSAQVRFPHPLEIHKITLHLKPRDSLH